MASGAAWSATARVGVQVCAVITTALVARMVSPSAYGLLGMAQVVTNFVSLLRDLGLGGAVVQRRELDDRLLSSLFWANLVVSVVCTVACWGAAPWAASFFREPHVTPVLRALSLALVLTGSSTIHLALLSRRLQFRTVAIAELSGAASGLVTAIALAVNDAGVWALVANWLVNSAVSTAILIAGTPWRPTLVFAWSDVRTVAGFSLNLTGFNVVNYFARNADAALIGRYLGNAALGYYQLAYTIMLLPVWGIAQQVVGRVLLPALSEVQDDHARFREIYLHTCAAIAFITFPMMAGVGLLAEPFVDVLLGSQYRPVASVLAILAPVGMIQSVATTTGQIYTAKGRTDLMLLWGLTASTLFVLSFVVGLPFGIEGVALSFAGMVLLLLYPVFAVPFRLVGLRVEDLFRALWPGLLCTLLMVLPVLLLREALRHAGFAQPVALLVPCSVFGAAVYFALAFRLRLPILREFQRLLAQSRGRAAAAESAA